MVNTKQHCTGKNLSPDSLDNLRVPAVGTDTGGPGCAALIVPLAGMTRHCACVTELLLPAATAVPGKILNKTRKV